MKWNPKNWLNLSQKQRQDELLDLDNDEWHELEDLMESSFKANPLGEEDDLDTELDDDDLLNEELDDGLEDDEFDVLDELEDDDLDLDDDELDILESDDEDDE